MVTPARRPTPPFPEQHQEKPGLESRLRPQPEYHAPEYRGANKLKDLVAIVTGGDSGIGASASIAWLPVRSGRR